MVANHSKLAELDRAWRTDLAAFVKLLGLRPHDVLSNSIRMIEGAEWKRIEAEASDNAQRAFFDNTRWQIAEELLWLAAVAEEHERHAALIASGKLRRVSASFDISWNNKLFDLLESGAVRAAMKPELHAIIVELFKAQRAYDRDLDALRTNPDPDVFAKLRALTEGSAIPETMRAAMARLSAFVNATMQAGRSRLGSENSKGKKRSDRHDALTPDEAMAFAISECNRNIARDAAARAELVKRLAKKSDTTPRRASKVLAAAGWPGRQGQGRPTRRTEKRNTG